MYGSSTYGSAAKSILNKLDVIENAALSISVGAMRSSPVISLHTESGIPPQATQRREALWHQYHPIMTLLLPHPLAILNTYSGVDRHTSVWLPGAWQPLLVQPLHVYNTHNLTPPPPQPTRPHSSIPPWHGIPHMVTLHFPALPPKHSAGTLVAAPSLQLDVTVYHYHLKFLTNGSHSPSPLHSCCRL